MLVEPPLDVAPVSVKAPTAVSDDAPAGRVKGAPLSRTVVPTTLGVSVSPTSTSLTEKLPAMAAMSCADELPTTS